MIYLDTASNGLFSKEALQELNNFNEQMFLNASKACADFRAIQMPELRNLILEFSDAEMHELALIPNTSYGFNAVLSSISDCSKVLLYSKEYNGLTMPFDLRNYDVYTFDDEDGFNWDDDRIKELLLTHEIDLFVFSEVQWLSGYRANAKDLCQFCHDNNIRVIMDISQSIGSLKFSFAECKADVVFASNYKWMNAGMGSALMWMKASFLDKYKPVIAGYGSAAPSFNFEQFQPGIRCYEPGHQNLHAYVLLLQSLKEKLAFGLDAVEQHNTGLCNQFIKASSDLGFDLLGGNQVRNRSSICVIKDPNDLKGFLDQKEIITKKRGNGIRIGFHTHNTPDELEMLIEFLREYGD